MSYFCGEGEERRKRRKEGKRVWERLLRVSWARRDSRSAGFEGAVSLEELVLADKVSSEESLANGDGIIMALCYQMAGEHVVSLVLGLSLY